MNLTRRKFLQQSAATLIASNLTRSASASVPVASFLLIGDTHFLADRMQTDALDSTSKEHNHRLIERLKSLPGSALPDVLGGGQVLNPNGLLHVGDLIDSGDKDGPVYEAMQRTEWAAYFEHFGLSGSEGRLKFPVMDIAGNHDAPHGTGYLIEQLAARHRTRKALKAISKNGLHYSWDWGGVHFVALGLIVGTDRTVDRKRRFAAMDSLDFLQEDLAANSPIDQPLVILHHVDMARYSIATPETDFSKWAWDPADVQAFYKTIKGRRAAIFYGHTHMRDTFHWKGTAEKTTEGIAVFNVASSGHFGTQKHGLFNVEVRGNGLLVRELATTDGWLSAAWTPQLWQTEF